MLGKFTSIEAVERWMREHDPAHPYFTIYHGFQTVAKKPSDVAYRNEKEGNIDAAIKYMKQYFVDHSANGGQWTIFAQSNNQKSDTTGKTEYVELLPYGASLSNGHAIAGLQTFTPSVSTEDIESKISGAINRARQEWEKDLHIKGLQARIEELENDEPEGVNITEVAIGFLETIVNKIPNDAIGRIFENFMGKATGETVDKMTHVADKYMTMKMQAEAMKAAQASKQQPVKQSDDDENDEVEYESI